MRVRVWRDGLLRWGAGGEHTHALVHAHGVASLEAVTRLGMRMRRVGPVVVCHQAKERDGPKEGGGLVKPREYKRREDGDASAAHASTHTSVATCNDGWRANVGICVFDVRTGMVFSARRVNDPSGAWQMPQGGIDKGEIPCEAALRELREETGIEPGSVQIVAESKDWLKYTFPTQIRQRMKNRKNNVRKLFLGQRQKWFLLAFDGSDDMVDLSLGEHREFIEWRWTHLHKLPGQIVPFKREVYNRVVEEFEPIIERMMADV